MRSRNDGGPGRHIHSQHADGFVVLVGEFAFELGDERATRGAGTAVVIPPEVVHRYEHETTDQGAFLNIHAPAINSRTRSAGSRRSSSRKALRGRSTACADFVLPAMSPI